MYNGGSEAAEVGNWVLTPMDQTSKHKVQRWHTFSTSQISLVNPRGVMRVHTKRWEMSEALWPWRWHDDLCARECRGCSRGRRGQRCYCLTHQHGVKAKSRLMAPCVYMCVQLAYELHWYLFNNWSHSHTHTHRPSLFSGLLWRLLLFYGLTCHDGGMTATLKVRQEREWRMEGRKDVVFRNGLPGSECQLKRREEMKDREWNRSRGKREREKGRG